VRIDDVAENNFVLANAATGESALGATDAATESTWVWQNNNDVFWIGVGNGAPVGGRYANWNGGEPNEFDHAGTGEDCGYFTAPGGGWNDNLCTDPKPYICETQ
jgi:hypothetical protein